MTARCWCSSRASSCAGLPHWYRHLALTSSATTESSLPRPRGAAGSCRRRSCPDLASPSVLTNRRHRPGRCRRDVPIRAFRWAELLLRVFREDVLVCPCGGRRVVIAFITDKKGVTEILEHLGLPTTGPPIAAARGAGPDQDPPWHDDVPSVRRSAR